MPASAADSNLIVGSASITHFLLLQYWCATIVPRNFNW